MVLSTLMGCSTEMKERKKGKIVIISSRAGLASFTGVQSYGTVTVAIN